MTDRPRVWVDEEELRLLRRIARIAGDAVKIACETDMVEDAAYRRLWRKLDTIDLTGELLNRHCDHSSQIEERA